MNNYFNLFKRHMITEANYCVFNNPTHHPDRIMVEHDFVYVTEGAWKIGQKEEAFNVEKGDVVILFANNPHYGVEPCLSGTKTMYIHALSCLEDKDGEENNIVLPSLIKAGNNPNVKACFEKVIYAKACKDAVMAAVYFDALLYELKNCVDKSDKNNIADRIRQMITCSDKMLKNYDIAAELNVSVKTAENLFKKAFNTTIHQYILNEKIEQAKFQIANFPDMKLYEIAENLGFYNEFHLSKQFKRITGLSPMEYKKQVADTKKSQ